MVPPGQSADLRAYYNKHAKTDRLDSQVLARLPLLHPEGLHLKGTLGPGEPLKRAVKLRSGLVHRVTASMSRLAASKSSTRDSSRPPSTPTCFPTRSRRRSDPTKVPALTSKGSAPRPTNSPRANSSTLWRYARR